MTNKLSGWVEKLTTWEGPYAFPYIDLTALISRAMNPDSGWVPIANVHCYSNNLIDKSYMIPIGLK